MKYSTCCKNRFQLEKIKPEQPSSYFHTPRLLKYKMADQMETEHLGHQQMLPRGHLAHTHLSAIIALIIAGTV